METGKWIVSVACQRQNQIFQTIASTLSMLKFAFIICTLMQFDPAPFLGLASPPGILLWAWENKGYACMMAFFLGELMDALSSKGGHTFN